MSKVQKLKDCMRSSPFNRSTDYAVNILINDLFTKRGVLAMLNHELKANLEVNSLSPHQYIEAITPRFQRSNTKWSQAMQTRFIENIISGCESRIQLFDVSLEGDLDNCPILDGLQRLTSVADFQTNQFPIFGDVYWDDIANAKGIWTKLRFQLHVFRFKTEVEACQFYIDMNRGITHSEDDLKTAYAFINNSTC